MLDVPGMLRIGGERALASIASRLGTPIGWRPEWAISVYQGASPFSLQPSNRRNLPLLTARDVTDVPALFVADPFCVRDGDRWFLFMEVLNGRTGRGAIGLATSRDGSGWNYDRIVLEEPFHQSFPCVVRAGSDFFMTPSGLDGGGIRLYGTENFPYGWRYVKHLVKGPLADPSIFEHEGRWWMYAGEGFDTLRLFTADALDGSWLEHPASPLRRNDLAAARPGGRVLRFDGRLYRFAQDCRLRYGHMVRAFEITRLTPTDYAERVVSEDPILQPSAFWNRSGMHHVDAQQLDDGRWLALVDGYRMKLRSAFPPHT